jgi:5-methylcytosine-specific restriction enzyme B
MGELLWNTSIFVAHQRLKESWTRFMASPFDQLVDIVHSTTLDSWKGRNEKALAALFGTRYAKRAERSVALRAPDMKGSDVGVPYAAYIDPSNADAGAYGGMSFVIFPAEGAPCLVALVIGTQGLAPDEAILGRPGHARKVQAICAWLNHRFGAGVQVAWAKQDPTRVDIDVPTSVQNAWATYERALKRYGRVYMQFTGLPMIAPGPSPRSPQCWMSCSRSVVTRH